MPVRKPARATKTAARPRAAKASSARNKATSRVATRKTATRRAMTKTTTKATAKATTAHQPAFKKLSPVSSAFTKTELLNVLSEQAGVSRKEAGNVLLALGNVIEGHIRRSAVGSFTLPGIAKIVVIHKPATKARKGINPFTGEETTFKAKPARNVVKIRALKRLKDMVN